ncbi:hypothetical protein KIH74_32335 [Kineosporia sp. J2-2]|uniref:Calcium-binding protein n=1 Tax=Kineosporia corallincola TaxID=2835133 RepID=A0ABS5TSB5_9ACTN|nr:calcium-binding protein [Kineosporia corallincola]MBT0773678.1 hypothetical protein [Kineosporia corallincola]
MLPRIRSIALLLGTAPLLLTAPAAQAADGRAQARVLADPQGHYWQFLYDTAPGANDLSVAVQAADDRSSFTYTVHDSSEIEAGDRCTHPKPEDLTWVTCVVENYRDPDTNAAPHLALSTGDGNDGVTFWNTESAAGTSSNVDLGPGDDRYGPGQTTVWDNTAVQGQDGDDNIRLCASGWAAGGEGDDDITTFVGPVEAYGGAGDDRITGGPYADRLDGGTGGDTVQGNDGNDHITGAQGDDILYGAQGDDLMYGNSGDDVMYGNSGDDVISGGPGTDTISGGPGNNTVTD